MSNQSPRNWASVYPLWINYCGVCDEYFSVKSKWYFIASIKGLRALPDFTDTFNRLENLIEKMRQGFLPMFDRLKLDNRNSFDEDLVEAGLNSLQKQFYSLTHYIGILKFVFFQRTVSYEIPEVVSGFPLSPERTIGNEAIYLAADKIAMRYLDCIQKDPQLKWDGAVSFVYPVQQEDFYGGISWPDNYLKHFHIIISEENKHFLGSLQILAHEISHVAHMKIKENGFFPNWLEYMWRRVLAEQLDKFSERASRLEEACSACPYCKNLCDYLGDGSVNFYEFKQNIADLLALLIGGPTTCYILVDMFLNSSSLRYDPLRPAFLYGYCLKGKLEEYRSLLKTEIANMAAGMSNYLPLSVPYCQNLDSDQFPCFDLMKDLGILGGQVFAFYENRVLEELKTELPVENITYPSGVNSLTSALVKHRFEITTEVESRINERLKARTICTKEDPRHILHCYYLLFRKGSPPDYVTTLYSLANNTFENARS